MRSGGLNGLYRRKAGAALTDFSAPNRQYAGNQFQLKIARAGASADTIAFGGVTGFSMPRADCEKFLAHQSGATALEYCLIAAGISIVIITVVQDLGSALNGKYTAISTSL